ncbi:unnamed protein product [Adineta steineri]|uniref:RBR-type E3 ubiquitin transferase n=2 Tax=Adineta steineri TaxID=433720 RepID=A0A813WSY5_9BILA|nr:unnamed protein product [Adineta steineri]
MSKPSAIPKNDKSAKSSRFYKERQGECSICSEPNSNLVNISKNCTHLANSCIPCLTQSITTDIESKGSYTFRCAMPACNVKFEPEEYYHLLDKRLTDITDNLLLHRTLEADEEFRWCKSSKGCGAGQLVSNHKDLLGYYTCHACHQMLCFRHSIEWHTGYSCDEFDKERAQNDDLASDVTVLAYSKKCPNEACGTPIMKLEGCDVMTCCRFGSHACIESKGDCDHGGRNYCGQRFCWSCLEMLYNSILDIISKVIRLLEPNCQGIRERIELLVELISVQPLDSIPDIYDEMAQIIAATERNERFQAGPYGERLLELTTAARSNRNIDLNNLDAEIQRQFGLHSVEVTGDGACSFRAILISGKQQPDLYNSEMRDKAIQQVLDDQSYYSTVLRPGERVSETELKNWADSMRDPNTYGDEMANIAVADHYHIQLVIFRAGELLTVVNPRDGCVEYTAFLVNVGTHYKALVPRCELDEARKNSERLNK